MGDAFRVCTDGREDVIIDVGVLMLALEAVERSLLGSLVSEAGAVAVELILDAAAGEDVLLSGFVIENKPE